MASDLTPLNARLCSNCITQIAGAGAVEPSENPWGCFLCFGITDAAFIDSVVERVSETFQKNPYDASIPSFALAFDFPTSQVLHEHVFEKLFAPLCKGPLATVPFKIRCVELYMKKINEKIGLRPASASSLKLTISFIHEEFKPSDAEFLRKQLPHWCPKSAEDSWYTKVRLVNMMSKITKNVCEAYGIQSPTRSCEGSIVFEKEPLYIAGRYCKFSRNLPQSPWTDEENTVFSLNTSVSEIVASVLVKYSKADNFRFFSSGREDIDVRMLGTGRPFCVQLLNPHDGYLYRNKEALIKARNEINKNEHVKVSELYAVTAADADQLNTVEHDPDDENGIEKRKSYTALCYSTLPIVKEALDSLSSRAPLEIIQPTVVRVLRRRPLIDRRRTVFKMDALGIDDHHFYLRYVRTSFNSHCVLQSGNASWNLHQGICTWRFWKNSTIDSRSSGSRKGDRGHP
ncbi:hypothetical protein L596_002855 [Steinernema carpocapsae]|uniref:tRNA pseudouridine(55) synthase n=1 Tax=Steinernema carpocapsae TaxID=34508 RepID=A0A4U8URC5_STECR|nr:hypothetical protein L596_002855 [Steinernema carpocapsae]